MYKIWCLHMRARNLTSKKPSNEGWQNSRQFIGLPKMSDPTAEIRATWRKGTGRKACTTARCLSGSGQSAHRPGPTLRGSLAVEMMAAHQPKQNCDSAPHRTIALEQTHQHNKGGTRSTTLWVPDRPRQEKKGITYSSR